MNHVTVPKEANDHSSSGTGLLHRHQPISPSTQQPIRPPSAASGASSVGPLPRRIRWRVIRTRLLRKSPLTVASSTSRLNIFRPATTHDLTILIPYIAVMIAMLSAILVRPGRYLGTYSSNNCDTSSAAVTRSKSPSRTDSVIGPAYM